MLKSEKSMIWAIGCLALLFAVCGVCGGAAYFLKEPLFSSRGASEAAKTYLKNHPVVQGEIGEIQGYGDFPSASYQYNNGVGDAQLAYSLRGTKGDGRATLRLMKPKGKEWEVVAARLVVGDRTLILKEGDLKQEAEPPVFPPPPPSPPALPEDPGAKT